MIAGTATRSKGEATGARRALWTMFRYACSVAALVHALFLFLFAELGLPLLVWANVASVLLFIGSGTLLQQRRNTAAMLLIVGETVLHAVAASVLLGWNSGFHYYMLTIVVPMTVAMRGTTFSKSVRLLAFGTVYAVLDAWTRRVPPVYELDPLVLDAIRYLNVAGMLAIMAFVSLTYYRLIASAESALLTQASTDALTGLYNRRQLLKIVQATRGAGMLAQGAHVLLCDIDHFKHVNDNHGHEMGDLVLQRVAHAVTGAVRRTDSVARWGGEEFVVLLPGADLASTLQTGERIRGAVAALGTVLPTSPPASVPASGSLPLPVAVTITITIGVARMAPQDTIDAAISRADAALYRGKAAGRNRVVVDDGSAPPPAA